MASFLYHGSPKQNLKKLSISDSGHKDKYVYAVSCEAFAAIFINRPGGSLLAKWGRLKDGTPYYCERKKGVFDANYANQKGSIYLLDKKNFKQKKGFWEEEWVSDKTVDVVEEIKISDIKEYLLGLEAQGKLKIILFKDRKKYFPNIDDELTKVAIDLINKYGSKAILPQIKKYYPKFNLTTACFKYVQKFPYKVCKFESAEDLLQNGYGDCRHKSAMLYELYQQIPIEVRKVKILFDWKDLPLPKELLAILKKSGTVFKHSAIQIKVNNKWITVDPSWDPALEKAGFPVTKNWDGKSATLDVTIGKIQVLKADEEIDLNIDSEEANKFADALNKYLKKIRLSYSRFKICIN